MTEKEQKLANKYTRNLLSLIRFRDKDRDLLILVLACFTDYEFKVCCVRECGYVCLCVSVYLYLLRTKRAGRILLKFGAYSDFCNKT